MCVSLLQSHMNVEAGIIPRMSEMCTRGVKAVSHEAVLLLQVRLSVQPTADAESQAACPHYTASPEPLFPRQHQASKYPAFHTQTVTLSGSLSACTRVEAAGCHGAHYTAVSHVTGVCITGTAAPSEAQTHYYYKL